MKHNTTTTCSFPINDLEHAKQKVLNWAKRFDTFCFLDNHQYQLEPHTEECLLAAGSKRSVKADAGNALMQLQEFLNEKKSWVFGHLGYELKNEIEDLSSDLPDHIGFADLFFFEPLIVIRFSYTSMSIDADDPQKVYDEISGMMQPTLQSGKPLIIGQRFTREEYLAVISQLKKHIQRGDCYEINFCQEFFVENALIEPVHIYQKLSAASPNPFSALYRTGEQWLLCASPERFLSRQGDRILSQPIKGTSKRIHDNKGLDEASKVSLQSSLKDRSENVMVVDLVRNDLAKICSEGSVKVEELFNVHSFPQVHQMISTVSGKLSADISFTEIIHATFPMGSMTGAPKKRVMELIARYEKTRRGIFSGALGYISPTGDFDFNVVIRSIMYNATTRYLSFQAGSGITWYSEPEKEWEECLLKAAAIEEVLTG